MGIKQSPKNLLVVSDGYVKYEEAKVHRSAIMPDLQDNEKKKIVMSYTHITFCFIFMVQLFCFFLVK